MKITKTVRRILDNYETDNPGTWMFHCRILTASPSTASSLKRSLQGMPLGWHASTHWCTACARWGQGWEDSG